MPMVWEYLRGEVTGTEKLKILFVLGMSLREPKQRVSYILEAQTTAF